MHRGRRGRLSSLFLGDPLWEVPCGTRSESDLLERWVHRSTALGWVFARRELVPWQDLVLFGILAGGWAGEMALASTFVPCQAELCHPGLNNSPSHCPPAFSLSEQSC